MGVQRYYRAVKPLSAVLVGWLRSRFSNRGVFKEEELFLNIFSKYLWTFENAGPCPTSWVRPSRIASAVSHIDGAALIGHTSVTLWSMLIFVLSFVMFAFSFVLLELWTLLYFNNPKIYTSNVDTTATYHHHHLYINVTNVYYQHHCSPSYYHCNCEHTGIVQVQVRLVVLLHHIILAT